MHMYTRTTQGAIELAAGDAKLVVRHCIFKENSAQFDGGAIQFTCFNSQGCEGEITGCLFERNTAGGEGGCIKIEQTRAGSMHLNISNSTFRRNTANQRGAAISIWGGEHQSHLIADSSLFDGNTAFLSGGALQQDSGASVELKGCTFRGNRATRGQSGGGVPCLLRCVLACTHDWMFACRRSVCNMKGVNSL